MGASFRHSMTWLHTWAGVVVGSLLFAIFWMGSLSVFDREIDRWMMPGTRLAAPAPLRSLDRDLLPAVAALTKDATQWRLQLPSPRAPALRLSYHPAAGELITRHIDPRSGRLIADQGSLGGSGFIFPFHYGLHLKWLDLGKWLVGLAGMAMLALLVSGVVIHRKLFAEFFTFRPRRQLPRSTLDLHNLSAVLVLPFHFMVTLSGLIIFIGIYFPQAHVGAYGSGSAAKAAYSAEAGGRYTRAKANQPGPLASLDAMLALAEREWAGGRPSSVRVWHPGDANSFVEVRRSYAHDITMNLDQIYFDAGTGAVLHRFAAPPVIGGQRFIAGLHFIQFEHWPLRWLYFLAGLAGCVMIASGLLFWLAARRTRHACQGLAGVRVVDGLTVGSVTGIIIATLALFSANRLLPLDSGVAGLARADLEMWAFYLAWLASFCHAWLRPAAAWREQTWAIAGLAALGVGLNVATTGDHLLRSDAPGWSAVAGMDALLLLAAVLSALIARRLGRPPTALASRRASCKAQP